jgi:four helix bundle protein
MEQKKYLRLNDFEAYRISYHTSNYLWDLVMKRQISRNTVGEQYADAIDSITANIAEGFGRKSNKDKTKFYKYTFASILKSLNRNEEARISSVISKEDYDRLFSELQKLPKAINVLKKFTTDKLKI